jgi:hypothetical protein
MASIDLARFGPLHSYCGGATMSRYSLLLLFVPLVLCSQSTIQDEIKPYEDGEAYSVYSAVLEQEKAKNDFVIGDTTVPFNGCLDSRSDKPVDAAIEDYKKMNRSRWGLGYHFALKGPYKLVSRKEADELLQPDKRTGTWHFSASDGIRHFSAVGFSADKSIAFVEMDVACGGLCGHGGPFILQRKKGKWVEYVRPAIQNADGSWTLPGASVCGWFY